MTHRLTWADFPETLRAQLEDLLGGPVLSTRSCEGGFSRSSAEILEARGGRCLFVKAVREADNPGSLALNRAEAAALAQIPAAAPVPALVDAFRHKEWFVLVTEAAPGQMPSQPWAPAQLESVLESLDRLQAAATPSPLPDLPRISESLGHDLLGFDRVAADPPADLDPWLAARLDVLREAARRGITALDGDTLCHSDLRADNLLVTAEGEVSIVDWAWASRGSRVADALQLLASVQDPDGSLRVNKRIDDLLDRHHLPRQVGTDVLTGILAFFVDAARWPHDPSLPRLGAHRRRMRDALFPLVRERWERPGPAAVL